MKKIIFYLSLSISIMLFVLAIILKSGAAVSCFLFSAVLIVSAKNALKESRWVRDGVKLGFRLLGKPQGYRIFCIVNASLFFAMGVAALILMQ